MTVLEEKIRKNREQYDAHEPIDGHFDRFSAKLDAEFHPETKRKPGLFYIVRYAAAVLVLAAVAAVLLFQYADQSSVANAAPANDELGKVIDHYDRLADEKFNEITTCTESDQEAARVSEMANMQLQKLEMDASLLKEKLNNDASNERVYGALVNNYRTRIKILDNIITNICHL